MRSCEATGKNIEQAIQNALLELKAAREDVDIKILSQGGFLLFQFLKMRLTSMKKEKNLKKLWQKKKSKSLRKNLLKRL